MNIETDHTTAPENDEENYKRTPESAEYLSLTHGNAMQNEASKNIDSNGAKIESASADNGKEENNQLITKTTRPTDITTVETLQNSTQVATSTHTDEVRIKNDPDAEETHIIDYGMPLSKTPAKDNSPHQLTDLDDTRLLHTANDTTNQEQVNILQTNLAKASSLNEGAAKLALDAFLDGIATPLAPSRPRLRVKNEFSVIAPPTPQRETVENYNESNSPPPPPPPFISTTTDSLAEGIATPHLSIAAVNRLRVKSEFILPPAEHQSDDSLPPPDDDFFKDLLPSEEIKKEDGEASASGSDAGTEEEDIPSDYFDDLTQDQIKERIENAQNCELEEKYSERLKKLQKLEKKLKRKEKHRSRKKQKKSKKKSHKRSGSRSVSPMRKAKERKLDEGKSQEFDPFICIFPANNEILNVGFTENSGGLKVKSECTINQHENINEASSMVVENVDEIVENLTPKQRKERAIKRAKAVLYHLKETTEDTSNIFSKFPFVSTVRKLPTSYSYVQQQIYENRSPLHTVNNVSYKFNSHTTRFNMEEWGLAGLPTHAAKLARQIGCNAEFIYQKLKTIKIPAKLKKVKQEPNQQQDNEDEEELVETSSSLYSNAMTQTDSIEEFEVPRKSRGYEIGVQVEPEVYSIGSQTLETQSPTEDMHKDDEAPIMKIIRDLNENQLMAIHAFAELIKIPNANSNAMEMYKIQMQIMDIYKMSQMPSALVTQQTQSVNNYSTATTTRNSSPSTRRPINCGSQQQSPIMHIKSVMAGDGTEFVMNDPRAKSAVYSKRIAANVGGTGSSTSYDNRHSGFSQNSQVKSTAQNNYTSNVHASYERSYNGDYTNNSSAIHQNHYAASNPLQSNTTKRYGRGAARR